MNIDKLDKSIGAEIYIECSLDSLEEFYNDFSNIEKGSFIVNIGEMGLDAIKKYYEMAKRDYDNIIVAPRSISKTLINTKKRQTGFFPLLRKNTRNSRRTLTARWRS